jgi:hypothetical protein
MPDLYKPDRAAPPTLLDVFAPPENYAGDTCLIVGFAADGAFLEEAMLQFTGRSSVSRAHDAILQGLVFLDPRQDPMTPLSVPGLVRLFPKARAWGTRKGLLHAKLLWLVFRHVTTGQVLVRVVVSTGNWTKSGAEHLIDLVWLTECSPQQTLTAQLTLQEAADCQAAAAFLRRVAPLFHVDSVPQYGDVFDRTLAHIEAVAALTLPPTRLIDSFDTSLGERIAARVEGHRPNFVLAGSGFFEQATMAEDGTPEQPQVLSFLEGLAVKTRPHRHVLVVNPRCAGAVARWHAAPESLQRRWAIHAAGTTRSQEARSLHAKFVLFSRVSGKQPLQHGASYARSLLYLGSGNLSRQGFLSSWHDQQGNIELGVLIDLPDELTTKGLRNALPIGTEIDAAAPIEAGEEECDTQDIPAPPAVIAVVGDIEGRWRPQWAEAPIETRLRLGEREYLVGPDRPFVRDEALGAVSSAAVWSGSAVAGEWIGIPAIDPTGAVCRRPYTTMLFDELLLSLSDWKAMDEMVDESSDLDEDGPGSTSLPKGVVGAEGRDQFPISRAAMLVEQIAQVHDGLALHELPAWLRRLEAILTEAIDDALLDAWRKLNSDFLACLAEPAFCPACLANPQDAQAEALRDNYMSLLTRIRARWQLGQES